MAEKRMSRKELHQPDQIEMWLYAASNYIHKNQKWFIIGSVVCALMVVSIFGGIQYYQAEQIKQANLLYTAQKILYETDEVNESQLSQAVTAFEGFLSDYPNQANSVVALMQLGKLYAQQKEWTQAEQSYKSVSEHPKALPGLRNTAKLSLAVIYEDQKKWDDAKAAIESIEGDDWRDVRWNALARIAIAMGDKETAKTNLKQLVDQTPDSVFKQEAETILLTLN